MSKWEIQRKPGGSWSALEENTSEILMDRLKRKEHEVVLKYPPYKGKGGGSTVSLLLMTITPFDNSPAMKIRLVATS